MSADPHSQLLILWLDGTDLWYLIDATALTTESDIPFTPFF